MSTDFIDILDESVHNLNDIKIAKKALKEVVSQISEETQAESSFIKQATKIISKLGDGVIDKTKPLTLDPESQDKDPVSKLLSKLGEIILCLEQVNMLYILKPYFDQLEIDYGVKVMSVSGKELIEEDTTISDLFDSSTSYLKTIKNYQKEIKEDHASKADESGYVNTKDYNKVLSIYDRGLSKGVDAIEDKCQDTITNCEENKKSIDMLETAINIVHDRVETT